MKVGGKQSQAKPEPSVPPAFTLLSSLAYSFTLKM
jgi:hypothetical protein